MIVYFIIALIVSLILVITLFIALRQRLQINWTGQNRKGIGYLLPVFIVFLFVMIILFDTFPRLLDSINLIQNNTKKRTISGNEIIVKNHRYIIDGKTYITGFKNDPIDSKSEYSISYLPNTKIIINSEITKTLTETEEPIIEEILPKN